MVKTKKTDESYFASLIKEITVYGELIKSRQEEKQAVIDEFDRESKRFYFGKISERTLLSSIKNTDKEINRIDKELKSYIKKTNLTLGKVMKLINNQEPKTFKATLSGVIENKTIVKKQTPKKDSVVSKKKANKKTVKKATKKTSHKKK